MQPLLGLYQSATQSYTQQLTSAAQAITSQLRSNLSATDARDGNLGLSQNEVQLSTLGWSSAAAYYLGFARLNGLTLSLASGIPTVNMPTFEGLSPSLQADIAPLFTSSSSFLDKLKTYVSTADGMTSPGGNADTLTGTAGTSAGTDGGGMMERLFRALNFTPTLLQSFVDNLSPTAQNWADPFGGLIALGNQMVMVAMTALGLAGIASTTTGTTATTLFNALTMNWAGVVGTLTLSVLMQFFATPIFMGCMALLIPGLTIAFVLPMIPWVMWIAGIIGYLILVCEAMVAVPLWMMAHLTYEGDGLHGRGFAGYELLFNILFRPVLMIIGLFLGYFIFTCASWLIRMSFGIAAAFVLGDGWIVTNWLGMFVLLSIFVLAHIVAAIASFRMITLIPHHVPRMIGFSSAQSGRYGRVCARRRAHRHAKSAHDDRQKSQPAATDFGNKKVGGTRRSESDRISSGASNGRRHTDAGQSSGIDTTMQATMDMGGPRPEPEDELMLFSAYSVGYDAGRSDEQTANHRLEVVHQIFTGARPVTVDQSYIDQLHAALADGDEATQLTIAEQFSMMRRFDWKQKAQQFLNEALYWRDQKFAPARDRAKARREENAALQAENARLREENAILLARTPTAQPRPGRRTGRS